MGRMETGRTSGLEAGHVECPADTAPLLDDIETFISAHGDDFAQEQLDHRFVAAYLAWPLAVDALEQFARPAPEEALIDVVHHFRFFQRADGRDGEGFHLTAQTVGQIDLRSVAFHLNTPAGTPAKIAPYITAERRVFSRMSRTSVLLTRAPSAVGKMRLTSALAADAALALRRALLLDTYEALVAAGEDVLVAFTPVEACDEVEALLARGGTSFTPQRGDDLGARMHAAIVDACARGADGIVLVGSDIPSLPSAHITEAFHALETHDLVLGPSEDGGYYLIGMREPHEHLFKGIAWGSDRVYEETQAIASTSRLTIACLAQWFDVDTIADLARVTAGSPANTASHTREWLLQRQRG